MATEDWHLALRTFRERLSLSRTELAHLTHISPETLRAYEAGRRKPSRQNLDAMLDALKLDRTQGNRIRLALGFAWDSRDYGIPGIADQFTLEELAVEIERLPWPAFAANEMMEIMAANRIIQKLWRVDLGREFLEPIERNALKVASSPRFARHLVNWDEAIGALVAMWKGHHRGPESLNASSPYFERLLKDFFAGDPTYVRRFLAVWERTPAREPKVRIHYRVVWHDDTVGEMRFLGILGPGNQWEALAWNDWVPVDAETWQRLEALKAGRQLSQNSGS
jgi:transcriptional regulator with XRE-family HTH domain